MDFDDFKDFVPVLGILLTVVIGYIAEFAKKNLKRLSTPANVRRPNPPVTFRQPEHKPVEVVPPKSAPQQNVFTEGERVTVDVVEEEKTTTAQTARNPKLEELRRAVIWSEILNPKFNSY